MNTTLTPEQARALRVARWALDQDKHSTETDAQRAIALAEVLQKVVDAFAQDAS